MPRWLVLFTLAVVLSKLFLVADEEVVRSVFDPEAYADTTADLVWFGSSFSIAYRVGAPLVSALLMLLGIPWRLGVEALFLLASFLLSRSLYRATHSAVVFGVTFLLITYHPWPLQAFRSFLSEPPYLAAYLITAGMVAELLTRTTIGLRDGSVWLLGVGLAVADSTRIETPFLLAGYLVAAVLVLARAPRGWRQRMRELPALAVPLLMLFAFQWGLKQCNALRGGVATLSRQESQGYNALMQALYRVWAPDTGPYAPVTARSLGWACDASPTLAAFRSQLLDPHAPATHVGETATQRRGEFGPHLNWLLMQSIHGSDDVETEALMLRAAAELEAALAAGKLKSRFAFYPMAPNYRDWVPLLPCAFMTQLDFLCRLPQWTPDSDAGPWSRDWYSTGFSADPVLFDLAANRRAMSIRQPSVRIEGTVTGSEGPVHLVALEDAQGRMLAVAAPRARAPHPFDSAPPPASRPANLMTLLAAVEDLHGLQLSFWRNGQLLHRMPFDEIWRGPTTRRAAAAGERLDLDLWRTTVRDPASLPQLTLPGPVKVWISGNYATLLAAGAALCFLLGLLRPGATRGRIVPLLLAFFGSVILLRLALYSTWLATLGYPVDRYMMCFSPILVPAALLAALQVGALARGPRTGAP